MKPLRVGFSRSGLAFGFAGGILVLAAAGAPLVDRDEPRYAQAVREMRESGDFLVPRNFGVLRPDKPILIYWLQSFTTWLVGEKELGFRLPSLLALGLWLWAASGLGKELAGHSRWVLLPGLALAGVYATPDCLVGALTTSSLLALLRAAHRGERGWAGLGWGLFGLGMLAKGPVTPLFVLPALAGYCGRQKHLWQRAVPWWGPLLAVALVAAWAVPASVATQGEMLRLAFRRHILQRSLMPLEGHGVPGIAGVLVGPPFYLASLWLACFPLAWGAARLLWGRWQDNPQLSRTVAYGTAVPLLVLSAVATKLPHYILPAAPLVLAAAPPGRRQRRLATGASTILLVIWMAATWQAPYRQVARALKEQGEPVFAFAPQEPSLRFYAGPYLQVAESYPGGFRWLLLRPGEEERLPLSPGSHLELVQTFTGWNLAKGRRERLIHYRLVNPRGEKEKPGPGGSSAEMATFCGRILAQK